MSPRAMMDKRIDSAVQAGSISQTDETALETALDAIDNALGVGSTGSTSGTAAKSKLDPSEMGDRIDDLIQQQVKAGTLTDDQASTLQSLFAQNKPPSGEQGTEGSDELAMGGVQGGGGKCAGGPPPGPPPSGSSDSDSTDSTSTDSTDTSKQLDALIAFLENMREKMSMQNSYSASGSTTSASDSSSSGLIVNTLA